MDICVTTSATNGTVTAGSGTKHPSSAQSALPDFAEAYNKVVSDTNKAGSAERPVSDSAFRRIHRDKPVTRASSDNKKSVSGSEQADEGASAENAAAAQAAAATTQATTTAESQPASTTSTETEATSGQTAAQAPVQGIAQATAGQAGAVDATAVQVGAGVQAAFTDTQASLVQGQSEAVMTDPSLTGQTVANAQPNGNEASGKTGATAGIATGASPVVDVQPQQTLVATLGGTATTATAVSPEMSTSTVEGQENASAADGGTGKAATAQVAEMAAATQGAASEAVSAAGTAASAQGTSDRSNGLGTGVGGDPAASADPVAGTSTNQSSNAPVGSLQSSLQADGMNTLTQAATVTGAAGSDQEVIQQILKQIEPAVRAGKNVLHLQLQPESLGRIDLRIASSDQGVTVTFRASQASTQAMLENHASDLRQALSEAGIHLSQFGVGQQGQSNGGFAQKQSSLAASYSQRNGSTETIQAATAKTWKSASMVDYRV